MKAVRAATDGGQPSPALPTQVSGLSADFSLSTLMPCSEEEVRRLIMQSPTKSCALDPIPTFLLKEQVDVLLPVTAVISRGAIEW